MFCDDSFCESGFCDVAVVVVVNGEIFVFDQSIDQSLLINVDVETDLVFDLVIDQGISFEEEITSSISF